MLSVFHKELAFSISHRKWESFNYCLLKVCSVECNQHLSGFTSLPPSHQYRDHNTEWEITLFIADGKIIQPSTSELQKGNQCQELALIGYYEALKEARTKGRKKTHPQTQQKSSTSRQAIAARKDLSYIHTAGLAQVQGLVCVLSLIYMQACFSDVALAWALGCLERKRPWALLSLISHFT